MSPFPAMMTADELLQVRDKHAEQLLQGEDVVPGFACPLASIL